MLNYWSSHLNHSEPVKKNAISTLFELKLTSSAWWLSKICTDGNSSLDIISSQFSFNADN